MPQPPKCHCLLRTSSTASTQLFLVFPWCPMWAHEASTGLPHQHVCDHHQGPHGAPALSTPRGSETRAWRGRCLAEMLKEPSECSSCLPISAWASGTCSISSFGSPSPFSPLSGNENKNRQNKAGLWAAGLKASQMGSGLFSLCL